MRRGGGGCEERWRRVCGEVEVGVKRGGGGCEERRRV